jgi:hypothetical protein
MNAIAIVRGYPGDRGFHRPEKKAQTRVRRLRGRHNDKQRSRLHY